LNIYNDTTKGFLAFLLRIKQAHTDGLLGSHWGEASGRRADIINEWCVVAGEKKLYPSTFELVQDIIAKMDNVTVEEIEAIGTRIESKNINTKFKRFYSAEFLKESTVKDKALDKVEKPIVFEAEELLESVVQMDEIIAKDKPIAKAKKKTVKKAK
tara:strand:- start:70358 stop:70825 length:468 start_codon:yes stop_codon:yes gene_type:complete